MLHDTKNILRLQKTLKEKSSKNNLKEAANNFELCKLALIFVVTFALKQIYISTFESILMDESKNYPCK